MVGLDSLRGLAILGVILYHINFNWMPGGFLGLLYFCTLRLFNYRYSSDGVEEK